MSDHSEPFKEVCANFGAAMYFAQVLEHGIANALLFLDFIPRTRGKWTPEEYDAFFNQNFDKTLGNLIKTLKNVSSLPAILEVDLQKSKEKRAFLAHHFFRERADAFVLGKFDDAIQELEAFQNFFRETDMALQNFVKPITDKIGLSEQWFQEALSFYKSQLRNDL
ncbi:hypothetical protein [Desulforegula conservatrix]|uniref:hypothetical protein n=1 Tax=Desulforegula conservatrix TaxID=153026 RepID=UPI0012EBC47F|nr:hypothetical protein [Desulforegula conservatrix]